MGAAMLGSSANRKFNAAANHQPHPPSMGGSIQCCLVLNCLSLVMLPPIDAQHDIIDATTGRCEHHRCCCILG